MDPAACPGLLSPTSLLEFPLLSAHGGAVCGRCLIAVGHRGALGCSGEDQGVWPLLAHLPGTSRKTGMTQLKLQTQSTEMKATRMHPTPSEGTKHAFTCRNEVHTFSRVLLTFLRVRLDLVRKPSLICRWKAKRLVSVSANKANRHLIYVGNNLQLTSHGLLAEKEVLVMCPLAKKSEQTGTAKFK